MANELAIRQDFSPEQIDLIKRTVAPGTSDDELALFLHQCQRTGLDPLSNQIYCMKRKQKGKDGMWTEKATIQVGIDGYRLIASRTGRYAPGEVEIKMQGDKIVSAVATVKMCVGGQWFDVKAEAYFDEYKQTFGQTGELMGLWKKMPRQMIAKCAEALALRKAFPAELSGIYTNEEMSQADIENVTPATHTQAAPQQIEHDPSTSETAIKKQIAADLKSMGVAAGELKEIATWLMKDCFAGDLAQANKEIASWRSQGLVWNSDERSFKAPADAATV